MKICENGTIRDMSAEEIAAWEAIRVEPTAFTAIDAMETAAKILLRDKIPESADVRIKCAALLKEWKPGNHIAGEVYTAEDQVWECFQNYDNEVYPDIKPGLTAWNTFNKPMHGASRETARLFVQPTGAHDIYKAGEWAIYNGKLYECLQDTAYSPNDYSAAWEKK